MRDKYFLEKLEIEIAELEDEILGMDPSGSEWSWSVSYLCSLRDLQELEELEIREEANNNY